jgi:hypothetical protein
MWTWITACCICAGLAAAALDVHAKVRCALAVAHWSAIILFCLRVALYTMGQAVA